MGTFNKASVDQLEYIVSKLGGNCQLVDSKGSNAFHYLAANKTAANEEYAADESLYRHQMADVLLKAGCDPNLENSEFETPFFTAISNKNKSFARHLLDKIKVKISARQSPNGKTLLALMAEHCIELDICNILQGSGGGTDTVDKIQFIDEFKAMAAIRDDNGLTPFHIAAIKLNEAAGYLQTIPAAAFNFLKFLYVECSSNPNDKILVKSSEVQKPVYSGFTSQTNEQPVQNCITPIFLLINDKHVNLIEEMLNQSGRIDIELTKIDLSFYDKQGLSVLLKACTLKQSNFVLKLLNSLTVDELCSQMSRGENDIYLQQNILQFAIQFGLVNVFEACISMCIKETDSKALLTLLNHKNQLGQNFLHLLASLDQSRRQVFTANRLMDTLTKLGKTWAEKEIEPKFEDSLLGYMGAKDKLGRTVLHLAMLNMHRQAASGIDHEIFFIERIFSISGANSDTLRLLKRNLFLETDLFERLPLHYLFFDPANSDTFGMRDNDLYKCKNIEQLSTLSGVYFGSQETVSTQKCIDPVELLTILVNQMGCPKQLDSKDKCGYTALHYAVVRGATISCSVLITQGCSISTRAYQAGNTPLSTSVYYKRDACVLVLLRSLSEANSGETGSLNDHYHLPEQIKIDVEVEEPDLVWTPKCERQEYSIKKLPLYQLILSHKWEGVSWLVLCDLAKYGLTQFEVLHAALVALEFSLAIRLLEKFIAEAQDKLQFKRQLTQFTCDSHGRTLLHVVAGLDLTGKNKTEQMHSFLAIMLGAEAGVQQKLVDEFVLKQDKLGSTPLHYACHMHNFDFVDFVLSLPGGGGSVSGEKLLTSKDAAYQTAYALLFWQVGRVAYTQAVRDKIKAYTSVHLKSSSNNLDFMSRAYFPLSAPQSFRSGRPDGTGLARDYPKTSKGELVSPLVYAVNQQDADMVKFLIADLAFNVNTSDSNNKSALVYAIQTNSLRLCMLLLDVNFEETQQNGKELVKPTKHVADTRMKVFLQPLLAPRKPVEARLDESEEFSEDETDLNLNNDESINEESREAACNDLNEQLNAQELLIKNFQVKSNIGLNQQDMKQRSIFHHLACSLDYGSFHNVQICRLLFTAYTNYALNKKLPTLVEFLKRVDSKVLSASDYALRSGNLVLYEEFQRLVNPLDPLSGGEVKLNKFIVQDKFYSSNSLPDYSADSRLFLEKYLEKEKAVGASQDWTDCFKVDALSNMSKTGIVVWDQKHTIPYDVILTKTDVSYGLYGMHNFYKMQLITQAYNQPKHAAATPNGTIKSKVFYF